MGNGWQDREAERLTVVASYPFDDQKLRNQLDGMAQLAARICDAPVGLVSIVGEDRQVFVGRSGIDAIGTKREIAFCAHAMYQSDCMVVLDATADDRFSANPLVTGGPGIRFYAGQPMTSSEGAPLGSLCVIDPVARAEFTPDQKQSLSLLAEAAMVLIEKWRSEQISQQEAHRSLSRQAQLQQQFNVLADSLPQMVWSTRADGMSDYFNRKWCEYTGHPETRSFGNGWLDFVHPDDVPAAQGAWYGAVGSEADYEVRYRLRRHDGEHRWVIARGLPLRDMDGSISRWIGTCTDVQDEIGNSEKLEMLSQELSHRIKNIFAVIGGLLSMTRRNNPELKPVMEQLQGRILSLGRAHDFVRPQQRDGQFGIGTASLRLLLKEVLSPYMGEDLPHISIDGEDLEIDDRAATPLALVFHELATNAMKYGALGAAQGHVTLTIFTDHGDDGAIARIEWRETGGPPVTGPEETNFGFRLIDMAVRGQMGGEIESEWCEDGLIVRITAPCRNLRRN